MESRCRYLSWHLPSLFSKHLWQELEDQPAFQQEPYLPVPLGNKRDVLQKNMCPTEWKRNGRLYPSYPPRKHNIRYGFQKIIRPLLATIRGKKMFCSDCRVNWTSHVTHQKLCSGEPERGQSLACSCLVSLRHRDLFQLVGSFIEEKEKHLFFLRCDEL